MIVKVQTDSTGNSILIYNEDRSLLVEFDGDEARQVTDAYCLGPLSKAYCAAKLEDDGQLLLIDEVEEPDW